MYTCFAFLKFSVGITIDYSFKTNQQEIGGKKINIGSFRFAAEPSRTTPIFQAFKYLVQKFYCSWQFDLTVVMLVLDFISIANISATTDLFF